MCERLNALGASFSAHENLRSRIGIAFLANSNVKSFVSLKKVQPPIPLAELQQITQFFPSAGFEFKLDPTFEPERSNPPPENIPAPDLENTQKFAILQRYNRVN